MSLVDIPREHESPSETPCTVHDIHEETEKNEDVVESISEPRRSHGDPRVNWKVTYREMSLVLDKMRNYFMVALMTA